MLNRANLLYFYERGKGCLFLLQIRAFLIFYVHTCASISIWSAIPGNDAEAGHKST